MQTYKSLCAQYYEIDKPNAPVDALNFYLEYAKLAKGDIYEPMCGTGRFFIPMLERSFSIEGSDASTFMLSVCEEKCRAKKLIPKLYHCFLNEMISDKQYALIFIPSGSFGLITDVKQAKLSLKTLYNMLLPNGKLVFEIETMNALPKELNIEQHSQVHISNKELISLKTISTYHPDTQVLQIYCNYELIYNDKIIKTEIEDLHVRHYQNNEIDSLLENVGFSKIFQYKAYEKVTPSITDELIIYECVKG